MNRKLKNSLLIFISGFLALILLSSVSFAARPLVTEDYPTVASGSFELETGFNMIRPMSGGGYTAGFVAQLRKGVASFIDLALEIPYNMSGSQGLADAVIHAKMKLSKSETDEGLTLRCDLKLTNGNPLLNLGSGFTDYGFLFAFTKKWGQEKLDLNLGYVVVGDAANTSSDDTIVYNIAAQKPVTDGIEAAVEYTGVACQIKTTANLQFGARWQVTKEARLDAGYSLAMNGQSNNVATIGLTSNY